MINVGIINIPYMDGMDKLLPFFWRRKKFVKQIVLLTCFFFSMFNVLILLKEPFQN